MVTQFFDLIDYSDHWGLLIPVGLLLYMGHHVCRHHEHLRKYGVGVGLFAFLMLFLRFALTTGLSESELLFDAVLGSALGAALVGSLVWLAAPIVEYSWRRLGKLTVRIHNCRVESKSSRVPIARPVDRSAPHEDDARRRAEVVERERLAELAQAQKRREEARVDVALTYQRYAPELKERFMREQLDEFMSKFMTDEHTAEQVQHRSKRLRDLIKESATQEQQEETWTIDRVMDWYRDMRKQISQLDVDERIIRAELAQLEVSLTELLGKCLERPPS